jgi:hypothetical protein
LKLKFKFISSPKCENHFFLSGKIPSELISKLLWTVAINVGFKASMLAILAYDGCDSTGDDNNNTDDMFNYEQYMSRTVQDAALYSNIRIADVVFHNESDLADFDLSGYEEITDPVVQRMFQGVFEPKYVQQDDDDDDDTPPPPNTSQRTATTTPTPYRIRRPKPDLIANKPPKSKKKSKK